MAILEQINQMKQQGFSDEQVIQNLREQGISPREISEALDQSQVKAAVSPGTSTLPLGMENMQPSVMQAPTDQDSMPMPTPMIQQTQSTTATQIGSKTQEIQSMPSYSEYPQEQVANMNYEQYPNYQDYGQYPQYPEQYQYPSGIDTETMTEISQQVTDEKLEKIKKQIQNLEKFKTEVKGTILDLDSRLTRIEKSIDLLQTSVLGKIGEYWRNVSELKDEMQATQDSFSKVLNPLSEQMEKIRQISGEPSTRTTGKKSITRTEKKRGRSRAKSNQEDGFENYLR